MEDKIYRPEEISETPFPGMDMFSDAVRVNNSKTILRPEEIVSRPLPTKKIAHEVISPGLNTVTKKIKRRYSFTPAGLLKDLNNDGIADQKGIYSSTQFLNDQVIYSGEIEILSGSFGDLPGSRLDTFTLERPTNILVILQASGRNDAFPVNSSELIISAYDKALGNNIISFDLSCNQRLTGISEDGSGFVTGWSFELTNVFTSVSNIFEFEPGEHSLAVRARIEGAGPGYVGLYTLGYIMLGT